MPSLPLANSPANSLYRPSSAHSGSVQRQIGGCMGYVALADWLARNQRFQQEGFAGRVVNMPTVPGQQLIHVMSGRHCDVHRIGFCNCGYSTFCN